MPLEREAVLADRYRIEKPLGEGGMGAVYLAKDLKFEDKYWAIKELFNPFQEASVRKQVIEQFEKEANMLAALSHQYLPVVSDHFEDKGNHYLVMEYIEGTSVLDEILDSSPPVTEVLKWGIELCEVLEYLHSRKPNPIIFRDLKPENIMLTPAGDVKLIDFGISKIFEEGTRTATLIQGAGTSGYSPPEQYTDGTDFTSDIYSLGCTLYSLLTCEMPPDAMKRVMEGEEFFPVRDLNPQVSEELEEIITKAVELKKENRYKNIKEMKKSLLDCLEDYEGKDEKDDISPSPALNLNLLVNRLSSQLTEVKIAFKEKDNKTAVQKLLPFVFIIIFVIALFFFVIYMVIQKTGTEETLPEIPQVPPGMVYIPPGVFLMGKDKHKISLADFYIDKFEVSNKDYKKFVDETGHPPPAVTDELANSYGWSMEVLADIKSRFSWEDGNFPSGRGDYPVVLVNWEDARAYAAWAGKRLPTEPEWEKACRGTEGLLFPWGNEWAGSKCNTMVLNIQDSEDIMPVDIYPGGASPYDVLNMIGNVWEWTSDYYEDMDKVVIKGGGWTRPPKDRDKYIYSYDREEVPSHLKTLHMGFRCCKDIEKPE